MNNKIELKDEITENNAVSNDISVKNCNLYYGDFHALKDINVVIPEKKSNGIHRSVGVRKIDFP